MLFKKKAKTIALAAAVVLEIASTAVTICMVKDVIKGESTVGSFVSTLSTLADITAKVLFACARKL